MKLAHLFFEVNMSNSHNGLSAILKKQTKVKAPAAGECAIFINRAWTAVKLLTADGTILHQKPKHGVNPKTLPYLPQCVEGKELNYQRALEIVLRKSYEIAKPNLFKEMFP